MPTPETVPRKEDSFPYYHRDTLFARNLLAQQDLGVTQQPIYSLNGHATLCAYELLVRRPGSTARGILRGCRDAAIFPALAGALVFKAHELSQRTGKPCHINVLVEDLTPRFADLVEELSPAESNGQVVIEVFEGDPLTKESIDVLSRLHDRGYRTLLDDVLTRYRPLKLIQDGLPISGVKLGHHVTHRSIRSRGYRPSHAALARLEKLADTCAQQGLAMVAEGANRRGDRKQLRKLGMPGDLLFYQRNRERGFDPL